MQVDVTTRLGALTPATMTGLKALDQMLAGGIRSGTLINISGASGVGKTALALMIAYMTARSRCGVLFVSQSLDQTEVMARIAARALYREYPETRIPYGSIWSGQSFHDERTRRQVNAAIETAIEKVGGSLHLHSAEAAEDTATLSARLAHLWNRYDRVVLVVDGIEALFAHAGGHAQRVLSANASLDSRVSQVAYELRAVAEDGCAVVTTSQARQADFVAHAATLSCELRTVERALKTASPRKQAFGARPVDLVVAKNRVGGTGVVPLEFIAGASIFEDRSGPQPG
jgi:replicative DNA helicase